MGRLCGRWLVGTLREGQAITAVTVLAGVMTSTATGLLLHRAQSARSAAGWRQASALLDELDEVAPVARPALRLVALAGRRLDGVS